MKKSLNPFQKSPYCAQDLIKAEPRSGDSGREDGSYIQDVLRWIANDAIGHLFLMGKMLDTAQQTSYLDAISGLPNMGAALLKLDKEVASKQPFAILLMDGDNLREFNSISYATGDEAIQKTGAVLSANLRPGDFVARWRTGDEFIAILPNTSLEGSGIVGERFREAIKNASKTWVLPSSVSVGIATYPQHGESVNALVDAAESATKRAKAEGGDRVILAQ